MFVIGITGGIGSGKSTVAARVAARGVPLPDADAIPQEVTAAGGRFAVVVPQVLDYDVLVMEA